MRPFLPNAFKRATSSRHRIPPSPSHPAFVERWLPTSVCAGCFFSWVSGREPPPRKRLPRRSPERSIVPTFSSHSILVSKQSYSTRTSTELLAALDAALEAAPEDIGKIWEAFANVCADTNSRLLLSREKALKVVGAVLHHADDLPEIETKLEYLEKQVKQGRWTDLKTYVANAYIVRNRESFTIGRALVHLEKMKNNAEIPDEDTYRLLMDALGSMGDGDGARQILPLMIEAGYTPDANVYQSIILGYARGNKPDKAMSAFRELQSKGLAATVKNYTTLMSAYAKRRDADTTKSIFAEMLEAGIQPTVVTYNVLLELCFGQKQLDAAHELFVAIDKAGLKPETDTFNIMIVGLSRTSRLYDAANLFEHMIETGMKPDRYTYGALIHGCAREGLMINAMRYYRQLLSSGITLNHHHFTILQSAFATARDMQTCQEVFRDMMSRITPTTINYNILISGWVRVGNLDKALEEFEKMKIAGCKPSGITWRRLIRGYLSAGRLEDALNAYVEHKKAFKKPSMGTYVHLIHALCSTGHMDGAVVLFQDLVDMGGDPIYPLYERIILGYLKAGNLVAAAEWLGRMRYAGFTPRHYLYNALIKSATLSVRPESAFQFYKDMVADQITPDTFTFNHLLLASFGDPRSVERVLQDMRLARIPFDHYTYATLLFIQSKENRNFEMAWGLWEEYVSAVSKSDTSTASTTAKDGKRPVTIHPAVARAALRSCAAHRRPRKARLVWDVIQRYNVDVREDVATEFIRLAEGWTRKNTVKGEKLVNLLGSHELSASDPPGKQEQKETVTH
ncbi:pentatricopeptide repeat domain-containing protein [Spizellomyces punctatus DAOM BR117]|uniref:Pentatricopeptide repeat domain-containing protein n=1 Tax=Spizellomyces punctatus (strain DAOM BR117) TaxID=645134 RepID=A0A0L0HBU6_SPIPD|nr:pentatricopeptide repeat domain-containing protein [Spizellomyces punctatus DAOM BR117]KNC98406.1 pentatricopeptide repeat domain-containing protein [Spizellomyces punctatus DAOM BR117]|eukprot:XP_016606446.1 pentatricopeptide repeat domain-containing protein [Spizellomyces punctatus DAOM BR117]